MREHLRRAQEQGVGLAKYARQAGVDGGERIAFPHGARTLGATVAPHRECLDPWMFMCDIDMMLTAEMAARLLATTTARVITCRVTSLMQTLRTTAVPG